MKDKLFRADVEIRSVDEEQRTVDYIASTEAVDSYGEIVEQDWILDRFAKNPVILFGHNRHANGGMLGMPTEPASSLPIGRAVAWGVEQTTAGPALCIRVQFATADLNPFADQVFRNVVAGYLKGGSVGFDPHSVRFETRNDIEVGVLSRNELFEFSICPMGANPDSVALAVGDKKEHLERLKALSERQLMIITNDTPVVAPADPTPVQAPEATQLAQNAAATDEIVARAAELELRANASETELAATKAELATLRKSAAETHVDSLIGKKLMPVAKDSWIELRVLSAKLFDSIVDSLPELHLTKSVIPEQPITQPEPVSADSADARLAARYRA